MRALLAIVCGTIGACLLSAASITTIIFTIMGAGPNLVLAALMLSGWAVFFGCMFIVTAVVGHATGVLEPDAIAKEGTDA